MTFSIILSQKLKIIGFKLFCEEYQETLFNEHHAVFDTYREKSILYGELVWNFVDFMTSEGK
jgi:hypothetical protein